MFIFTNFVALRGLFSLFIVKFLNVLTFGNWQQQCEKDDLDTKKKKDFFNEEEKELRGLPYTGRF